MLIVRNTLINIIEFLMSAVAFLIGLRIILKFFQANPATPFVSWIYNTSDNLIYPFSGIFPNISGGGSIFDITAMIALLAYIFLGYLVIALIGTLLSAVHPIHEHY